MSAVTAEARESKPRQELDSVVIRFAGDSGDGAPEELMLLMLCAMVGSVAYVGGATVLRLPVGIAVCCLTENACFPNDF